MQLKLTKPLKQHSGDPSDPLEPPAPAGQVAVPGAAGGTLLSGHLGHRSAREAAAAYLWREALSRTMTLKSNLVDQYLLGLRLSTSSST